MDQGGRQRCIELVAIHEFGHALSFAHEQNRPEGIPTDVDCRVLPGDFGSNGDVTIGLWDRSSVMNYCNQTWTNNGQLSDVDRYMVRAAYGNVPRYHSIISQP